MGQAHDKNKEKYRAREILSFRALYLFIYLFIYIYIYPYIFFTGGGRSIRIFQSRGGEGNKWTLIRIL